MSVIFLYKLISPIYTSYLHSIFTDHIYRELLYGNDANKGNNNMKVFLLLLVFDSCLTRCVLLFIYYPK